MQVNSCYFTRCESGKGGALYFQDGTKEGNEETSITMCTFIDCYASGSAHEGYAIYCRSYKITIEECNTRVAMTLITPLHIQFCLVEYAFQSSKRKRNKSKFIID